MIKFSSSTNIKRIILAGSLLIAPTLAFSSEGYKDQVTPTDDQLRISLLAESGSGELPVEFLNGPDIDNFTSFWLCEDVGETNPEKFYSMRFFDDGNGAYGGNNSIIEFSWSATGSNVGLTAPGNPPSNFAFANIEFSDQFTFNTQFEYSGGSPVPTICVLYGQDQEPLGNVLPSHGGSSAPTTQQPPTTTGSGSINESLLNGPDIDNFTSFWLCEKVGETNPESFYSMRFFEDGHGAYGANNSIIEFSWLATGSNLGFTLPGDSRNITYVNIEFSDQFTFNTQLEITDISPTPTICVLYDLDGPIGNDLPSHGGTPTTQQPPTTGSGSIDDLLVNVQNNDAWRCTTTVNDHFLIAFLADGRGVLLTSSNQEAQLKWALSEDSVVFSINRTADSFIGG